MEKNRQTKVIAIIALVVAVIGMSVGFAAFSNTLTISSSATVTPNEEDFKLVAYGLGEIIDYDTWVDKAGDLSLYTSKTSGMPTLDNSGLPLDSEAAKISASGDQISITNLAVTFEEPGEFIFYPFLIKNEGAYDAYITGVEEVGTKTCSAREGTTQSLMEAACERIRFQLYPVELDGGEISPEEVKVAPGDAIIVVYEIRYRLSSVDSIRADGPFDVVFPDIKVTVGTAAAN